MLKATSYLILFVGLFMFTACEPKLSLNADYTTTPVVFGLLDHNDSVHYIKITKTFLGDGNNFEYAKVQDSSDFKNVSAKVIEFSEENVKTGREWILKDSTINTKKPGVFYAPSQKVFIFHEKDLNPNFDYRLEAILNEGEYQIDATTSLLPNFEYSSFMSKNVFFATATSSVTGKYKTFKVVYSEALNAQRYQTRLIINIKETYIDNSVKFIELVWSGPENNGFKDNEVNPNKPANKTVPFEGSSFYQFIKASVKPNDNVEKRELLGLDVITEVGHSDLARYMDISKPSSSLAQSLPLFTNVNGGLGLFSSRLIATRTNMPYISGTIEELCVGQYTNGLKFCSTDPLHAEEFFYCN